MGVFRSVACVVFVAGLGVGVAGCGSGSDGASSVSGGAGSGTGEGSETVAFPTPSPEDCEIIALGLERVESGGGEVVNAALADPSPENVEALDAELQKQGEIAGLFAQYGWEDLSYSAQRLTDLTLFIVSDPSSVNVEGGEVQNLASEAQQTAASLAVESEIKDAENKCGL